ncbi:WXG100 family type VII secretion target [Corynebacterium sp. 320]|uniref:ESAT-6-like protein n=1 Tax=Corynebacterium zhongnanshanii TaxID=2768834 RepID=A0ABQ6VEN1_9CORY|nr:MULTISPECIES: WXG100 family type VII secretion target [Corynebacterium]KAB1504259.1 WXG100 family type VII secretion target [Corynebacterium sp. 320]KAB1552641.1 WXG100 family type VII secretion target [Corynebacterium sp. 321]KAB1554141.1 WXG100 family type VII secretion target [Corynebacterium sp. 319]KAB3522885.1 WXG100 family type VII secretion target [Corynebacterium zhongnanshanii]KAB3528395.1 WXG100 family type VII secretion target [Corynebacterium sp. 250]
MSFKTDVATMTSAASNVDNINGEVQGELSRLQNVVDSVSGAWKGQAQGAFQGLMERWNQSARELNEALMSISDNLRANAHAFDDTEMANAAAFNG